MSKKKAVQPAPVHQPDTVGTTPTMEHPGGPWEANLQEEIMSPGAVYRTAYVLAYGLMLPIAVLVYWLPWPESLVLGVTEGGVAALETARYSAGG